MVNVFASRCVIPIQVTVPGESFRAYIPPALPPDPALDLNPLLGLLEKASTALGRLDGLNAVLPSTDVFIYQYVRKEALLSSQIEGTQSSFSDLLLFEHEMAPGVPLDDVREVSNYVGAMEHGLKRLAEGFPLSARLWRELHEVLLRSGRGQKQAPGEFRTSQNWIHGSRPGNAEFVPPPHQEVMRCIGDLEKFLHQETSDLPTLIKAGLAHVQFETIHPFLDGNGRLGRLLVVLFLVSRGMIAKPLLYISLYLKANRSTYYALLQKVRFSGAWEEWLEFFLNGVIETANQACHAAERTLALFSDDRARIAQVARRGPTMLRVHEVLQKEIIGNVPKLSELSGLTQPTVQSALIGLGTLGIVREISGRQRNRIYVYERYLEIMSEGTQPLPR